MTLRGTFARACALALILGCGGGGGGGDDHVDGTGTIGPDGGTVSLSSGPTVQVPAGALSVKTPITISASTVTAPSGAVTAVYQFGPEGTSFAVPVRVSFPVPAGTKASDVTVYWTRKGSTTDWELLQTTLSGTTASAETTHFSAGFVGATGSSYAGPITIARTYRVTPPSSAAFIQTDEVSRHVPPNATRTVVSAGAPTFLTRSFTFDAGAVLLDGIGTYQADGTPAGTTTYVPPQLVIPASTTAGATASSTSTATTKAGETTTFTVTRSMTVNGVEAVTVPAGTFSALKITTALAQSNLPASHVVNWWAPGIGSVKSVGYADANPSATTVTELLRSTPMVCSGETCACNALVDSAAEVQSVYVAASLPAPAGGSIQDGTYHLTAERLYTGVGGASGPTGQSTSVVLAFQSGRLQIVSRGSGAGAVEERTTLGYEVSGAELILTPLCGMGPGDPERVGFTAAGTELRLLDPGTPPEPGKEAVLTRQ